MAQIRTTLFTIITSLAVLSPALAQTFEAATEEGTAAQLDLVGERLTIELEGQYSTTTRRQTFLSTSKSRLEGRYVLKAGEGARVQGFSYWNGEKKIVGEVFEKNTARQVYQEVTGLGRDPGLLEQVGEGAFSFRVFPIEPGERKPIETVIGKWLPRVGNVVEYRAPVGLGNASISVALRDDRGYDKIVSPTHRISIVRKGTTAQIRAMEAKDGAKEFVLRYQPKRQPWQLSSYVHKDAGHDGYLAVTLATPPGIAAAATTAKDITLVLDRSGSMAGEPLKHAKLAAKAVVSRLGKRDRLNVVLFDDGVDKLYAKPKKATPEVITEALLYIDKVNDAGGTDIARALKESLAAQIDDDQPNVVLFLTDGQSSSQQAITAAKSDKSDARLFTIGVGSGVEKPLLSRLAKEKRGRFTYIDSPEAIGGRMKQLYSRIETPVMVDVAIEVEGVRVQRLYPRSLPDLYKGDELRIASRVVGSGNAKITVRGVIAGKPVVFHSMATVKQNPRPWVGRLWAESRVDDLLEEIALNSETEELKNEVINLAVAYNFVTPYTSFLAIPESELTDSARSTLADARSRKQKILAAHKDAVALSRTAMPPGDPVLRVKAPADALQVTAHFPFGLEKDLVYDAAVEQWKTRFLVPKSVVDGTYEIKIVIVHSDGKIELAKVSYTIDSKGPEIEVDVVHTSVGARILVRGKELLRSATIVTDDGQRIDLVLDPGRLALSGEVPLAQGRHQLVLVVADAARNETEKKLEVEIK